MFSSVKKSLFHQIKKKKNEQIVSLLSAVIYFSVYIVIFSSGKNAIFRSQCDLLKKNFLKIFFSLIHDFIFFVHLMENHFISSFSHFCFLVGLPHICVFHTVSVDPQQEKKKKEKEKNKLS